MRNAATLLSRIGAAALVLGILGASAPRAVAQAFQDFTDNFSGTTLNPRWEPEIPIAGPEFTVNNGLKVYVPPGPFDDWSTVNNAPRIQMPAPTGDFTMTGRITSVVGADGTAPATGNYHAALMVKLGDTNKIYWGMYTNNTTLRLERSGSGIRSVTIAGPPVDLRVIRVQNVYHFYYKLNEADPWIELVNNNVPVTITDAAPVQTVGILQKTWGAGVELTANWSRFTLSAGQNVFSSINGTVATNGPSPSKLHAQLLNAAGNSVLALTPIADNGTFSFPAEPGTYTVRLVGSDLLSSQAEATKSVTVQAGSPATVSFTGIQVSPDLNPATSEKFTHNFTGPTLDPNFAIEMPKAGATINTNNGLQISVPANNAFDYWSTIDESPKVRIPAPAGDFITSVQINATDLEGNPATGNFNAYLAIKFAPRDAIVYTLVFRDTTLEVLRLGGAEGQQITIPPAPVWVQVRKVGNRYSFYYKNSATDQWLPFAATPEGPAKVITDIRKPQEIQLGLKTWDANVSPAVRATFNDFSLEAVKIIRLAPVTGTVTTNGPSPANTSIQLRDATGTVVAVVPVAANGSFSTTVAEGAYTATVIGNMVVPGQAAATKTVNVVSGQANTVDFTVNLVAPLVPGSGVVFTDAFTGTTLKPEWTVETPVAGPTVNVDNGTLNITLPGSRAFDIWAGIPADQPRVTLPNPVGDFVMTATLNGVTDTAGEPIENRNFHSGLYVHLGGSDAIMWGAYRSNNTLRLERSGTGFGPNITTLTLPAQLQIRRVGNTYTFFYRQQQSDAWSQLMESDTSTTPRSITVPTPAERVGVFQKSWEPLALTAKWSNFSLESVGAVTPAGCKGNVNDDKAINIQDAVGILRHIVSGGDVAQGALTGQALQNADVDGQGGVNVQDAVLLLQAIVNIAPGNTVITNLTCP
ncbi:MAG: hypothetical protein KY468_09555 [Armatimonadetes bacterium]|nr:hypothetical protein [Armatimonadota bacterium]